MTIEVHAFAKEIPPGRTIAATMFLLVVCCALAIAMSWKRANNPLTPVSLPADWNVRFEVPRMFEMVAPRQTRGSTLIPFAAKSNDAKEIYFVLWKAELISAAQLEAAARDLMADVNLGTNLFGEVRTRPATVGFMGNQAALEVVSLSETAVVRIVKVGADAYAVLYAVRGSKLEPEFYHWFDLTCRSMSSARK